MGREIIENFLRQPGALCYSNQDILWNLAFVFEVESAFEIQIRVVQDIFNIGMTLLENPALKIVAGLGIFKNIPQDAGMILNVELAENVDCDP